MSSSSVADSDDSRSQIGDDITTFDAYNHATPPSLLTEYDQHPDHKDFYQAKLVLNPRWTGSASLMKDANVRCIKRIN